MKPAGYLAVALLCCWSSACRKSTPDPDKMNLSGSWVMFQRQYREGDVFVPKPIASVLAQTITFTYPHTLSSDMEEDTILSTATYFEFGGGGTGVVGPYINFKKSADRMTGNMFSYNLSADADTLRLVEFGRMQGYRYSFRRL